MRSPLADDRCLRLGTDISKGFGFPLWLTMSVMIGSNIGMMPAKTARTTLTMRGMTITITITIITTVAQPL